MCNTGPITNPGNHPPPRTQPMPHPPTTDPELTTDQPPDASSPKSLRSPVGGPDGVVCGAGYLMVGCRAGCGGWSR